MIYIDAGCSINPKGNKRFKEYIKLLNNSDEGIISFQVNYIEKKWTTKEIFNYFNININSEIANRGQFMSTVLIMKKNKNLLNLIDIYNKALHYNPLLFTDYYNKNNQEHYFKDNRHDQSIFSVIRKMINSIVLKDETNEWKRESDKIIWSPDKPFWATRLKN